MAINLVKGGKINLQKEDGTQLTQVFMGLGWDEAKGASSIDLDASVILFDENKNAVDTVSFKQKSSICGSIKHSGDNLTGVGSGDDEVINVNLTTIPVNVKYLCFVINSYRGQKFTEVENCFSRVVDKTTNVEFCRYTLSEKGDHTGKLMCTIYRHNGVWKINPQGLPMNGRVASDLIPSIQNVL